MSYENDKKKTREGIIKMFRHFLWDLVENLVSQSSKWMLIDALFGYFKFNFKTSGYSTEC